MEVGVAGVPDRAKGEVPTRVGGASEGYGPVATAEEPAAVPRNGSRRTGARRRSSSGPSLPETMVG